MNACFIFGALPVEKLTVLPRKNDFVIAADRGVLTLEKFGVTPDLIVGDFDSLGYLPEGETICLPVQKDKTDVGYAVDHAFEKGYREFFVYGALGGLTDHTAANLQICAGVSVRGGRMYLLGDEQNAVCITDSKISLKGSGRISVFAFGQKASGVTLKGLGYCLDNAELSPYFPLGVSNGFSEKTAEISVSDGTLLIIWNAGCPCREQTGTQNS